MQKYHLVLIYLFLIIIGSSFGYTLAGKLSLAGSLSDSSQSNNPNIPITSIDAGTFIASPDPKTTILILGDIMLGRSVNLNSLRHDFTWPFFLVAERLRSADIVFGNLENPLVDNCLPLDDGMIFCSPSGSIEGLNYAGIDIVSLANNHSTNYGMEGLTNTIKILNKVGISHVGLGEPVVLESHGVRFAFLAYNDIGKLQKISPADPAVFIPEIQTVTSISDIIIVSFHWGIEYTTKPSDRQIMLAHKAIDAGADVVVGAHPHWVQSEEIYHNKPIFYSLGNFIFDQEWSQETKEGMVIGLNYQKNNLVNIDHLPVLIENYGQPHWTDDS